MARIKKFVISAVMTLLFGVLIAMLCGNAAHVESDGGEYVSYDVAAGTVTYYNVVTEDGTKDQNEGGDYSYNPAEITK